MDLQLTGKVAMVAASSRGLGRACAIGLAREGVNTVVLELDADRVRWQQRKSRATARPGDGTVYAVVADATALPIKDGAGRRVSAISSLEHIPDDAAVGREIGRVLADDGRIGL